MGVTLGRLGLTDRILSPVGWVGWWLYQPYKLFILIPIMFLMTIFFGFLPVLLLTFLDSRRVSFICGALWARFNAYLTPMLVTVSGRENIDPEQSYVIISNHFSFFDVFVLYGWLGVDFKWVIKKEMRRIPGLGIGCEKLGHIFIDRSDRKAALASINAAKPRFIHGTSVIFFPEGTRSRTGRMGPFKKGAFRVALDLGLPILPITLIGTPEILPPTGTDLLPGRAEVIIHPPVLTEDVNEADLLKLMNQCRGIIAGPLKAE
ncbi:MAG: 1-acyl-sn-glycerol-3-phosphate acyltransferase [Thermoanaerobaculales bacterium]|nr:1-acyl-sn-glycerol-3-phosphate acyltransferase [Thermoanaerobaculales bacterium]